MSDSPATDADDIELKKRARRRLVGACALALLAVIVLPLVLNREMPRTVPDMQVSIPGRGDTPPVADIDSSRVDIEPDAVSVAPGLPSLPAQPAPLPAPEPPVAHQPVQPAPVPPPPSPPLPRETRREAIVTPRPSAQESEAARVTALLGGTGASPEADKGKAARNQAFVQVGAFGDTARAVAQAEELKKQGFAAYAEKVGNVTRVRIGPLPRDEAKQVVARLKAKGRKAMLSSR